MQTYINVKKSLNVIVFFHLFTKSNIITKTRKKNSLNKRAV